MKILSGILRLFLFLIPLTGMVLLSLQQDATMVDVIKAILFAACMICTYRGENREEWD